MKVVQVVLWVVVFLLVAAVSSFAHCGKDHKQVLELTPNQLQQKMAEAGTAPETLMLRAIVKKQDDDAAKKKKKEEKIREKELDDLHHELKIVK